MKKQLKNFYNLLDKKLDSFFLNNLFFRKTFLRYLEYELKDCHSILEIGAGQNSYLKYLVNKFHITGLDISIEQFRKASSNTIYNEYIIGDARKLTKVLGQQSFDAIICMDFLEHLTKEEGYLFLSELNRINTKKIILYTPNGFLPQPPTSENPFQEHKSGWAYEEMKNLGFKVYGINGLKWLTGLYAVPKIKPISFGKFLRNISSILLKIFRLERLSFSILCIKQSNK